MPQSDPAGAPDGGLGDHPEPMSVAVPEASAVRVGGLPEPISMAVPEASAVRVGGLPEPISMAVPEASAVRVGGLPEPISVAVPEASAVRVGGLPEPISMALREALADVAGQTIAAVVAEVPGYERALRGAEGQNLTRAVELALRGFLILASGVDGADPSSPLAPALDGAYALGRGEARSGRSMDALLAAYRVGARVAWRELGGVAVASGLPAARVVEFAELVFAYIDQLSAASVSGHTDQLATTGRVRERYLYALGHSLVTGGPQESLLHAAQRADWEPPARMVAIILAESAVPAVRMRVDQRALQLLEDVPGIEAGENLAVLLVPVADRAKLLSSLADTTCLVGPTRDWHVVAHSYHRALRGLRLGLARLPDPRSRTGAVGALDTDEHLPELVVAADAEALADLRDRALAPLRALPPATAVRLSETLGSWLRHQGRREDVAGELFVHPQTVRYRMGQIRAAYGAGLDDPRTILELTIALTGPPAEPAT